LGGYEGKILLDVRRVILSFPKIKIFYFLRRFFVLFRIFEDEVQFRYSLSKKIVHIMSKSSFGYADRYGVSAIENNIYNLA